MAALVAALLGGCGESRTAEEMTDAARRQYESGELKTAVIELKNILLEHPGDATARALLGEIYVAGDDGAAAEKELTRAIASGLNTPEVDLLLLRAMLLQGKFQALLDHQSAEVDLSATQKAERLTLRAYAHLGLGAPGAADTLFDEALAAAPGFADAALGKARVLLTLKDRAAAREWIDKALQESPKFAPAWSLLGDVERSDGKLKEAEAAYSKAIDASPVDRRDRINRALTRAYLGDFAGAEADVNTAQSRHEENAAVSFVQGVISLGRGETTAARDHFLQVQKVSPGHAGSLYYLGVLAAQDDKLEQAEDYLSRFLTARPDADEAAIVLTRVRARQRDFSAAEATLGPLLTRNPDDPKLMELMADLALVQGRGGDAEALLRKLAAQEPGSAEALTKLALGLLVEGEGDEGRKLLQQAAALEGDLPRAKVLLVFSHLQAGDPDAALAAAEALVQADPEAAGAIALKGTVLAEKGDLEAATAAFEHAWQLEPGHYVAGRSLALFALAAGDADRAYGLYADVLEKNPGDVPVSLAMARIDHSRENVEGFVGHLEDAIKTHPEDPRPRVMLGHHYRASGRVAEALALVAEPSAQALANADFLELAGVLYQTTGQYAEALEAFDRLAVIVPDKAQLQLYRGMALQGLGRNDEARAALQRALELNPADLNALASLTGLEIRLRRFSDADALLTRIEALEPKGATLLRLRANYFAQQGNLAQAAETAKALMALQPARENAADLVQLLFVSGETDQALAAARDWLARDPDDLRTGILYADALARLDRKEEARKAYEDVLAKAPLSPAALNNLANLVGESDVEIGLGYARQAYEITEGTNPAIADTYGWLLLKRGESPQEALSVLREAHQALPDNPEIALHYATALHSGGFVAEARPLLAKIAAGDSDESATARRLLEASEP